MRDGQGEEQRAVVDGGGVLLGRGTTRGEEVRVRVRVVGDEAGLAGMEIVCRPRGEGRKRRCGLLVGLDAAVGPGPGGNAEGEGEGLRAVDGVGPVEGEGVLRVDGDGDPVGLAEGCRHRPCSQVDVGEALGGADELVGEEFGVCLGMVDQAAGLEESEVCNSACIQGQKGSEGSYKLRLETEEVGARAVGPQIRVDLVDIGLVLRLHVLMSPTSPGTSQPAEH